MYAMIFSPFDLGKHEDLDTKHIKTNVCSNIVY